MRLKTSPLFLSTPLLAFSAGIKTFVKFATTRLQLERTIMAGKNALRFSRITFATLSRSVVTLVLSVVLFLLLPNKAPAAERCPAPSFATAVNYQTGRGCWSVAVGDFNGDGKPDLAVANRYS